MARARVLLVQLQRLQLEGHNLVAAIAALELALDLRDDILLDDLGEVVVLEADALDGARGVLQGEGGHLGAALRQLHHHIRDHTHEHRVANFLRALGQVAHGELRQARQRALVGLQRVLADVDLHDLLLVGQLGALVPLHAIGLGHVLLEAGVSVVGEHVEHGHLAVVAVLLALGGSFQKRRLVHEVHELLARVARGVEGTALDE